MRRTNLKKKAYIPISALLGALLLALVAAMTPFVADPDRVYAQSQSQDTTLYELSIDGQSADPVTVSAFMPAFVPGGAPDEDGYTVYAATGVSSMTVTATASHTGALVEGKSGATEAAAEASAAITAGGTDSNEYSVTPEAAGEDTVVLVKVTAADNIETATYNLTVVRGDADSGDTTLSALSLMAGSDEVEISPEFAAATRTGYTARVPYTTSSVEVSATPTDARDGAAAAVTSTNAAGDDNAVQNGVVSLSEGDNTITVTVTAADKVTTGTYTVTVTRVPDNESTDTTLTTLSLTDGTNAVSLSPAFRAGTAPASNGYTARVASGIASVNLTAIKSHVNAEIEVKAGADEEAAAADTNTAISPTGDVYTVDSGAGFQVEGRDTVILVTVTAEDDASKATYKVTVERAAAADSTETTLSALSVMAGGSELTLTPEFATGTTAYAASVPYSVSRATVMATPINRGATYAVTKGTSTTALAGGVVGLDEGANTITVTVTAADGSTTNAAGTYVVTVTRAASTDSMVTTLATLSIADTAGGTNTLSSLEPEFDPDGAPASGGYMAYAATGVTSVDVTATASHTGATVAIRVGDDEEAAMEATPITGVTATLEDAGESTVILVTVTGADQFATSTYKITVMRRASGSNVITLNALSLMDADDNEITIADTDATDAFTVADCLVATQCTSSVPNATTMVEVSATPTDARDGATYKVTSDKDSSVQNGMVDLAEGANVITVTVTGADKVSTGDAGTYMVTVTRVASNLSTDTTLSVLTVNDGTDDLELEPDFVANSEPVEGGYAAEVASTITSVIVTAATAHTGASIEVRAGADYDSAMEADAISGSSPYTVNADAGFQGEGADTIILVTVTASDLATTGTHMITVSREAAEDNSELKSLMLNGDAVSLPSTAPTDGVHARVIVDVPSVMVMATPRNSMATVVVTSNEDDDVEDNVVDLAVGINVITVKVTAAAGPATATTADDCLTGSPDANIDCYTIRVRRDLSDDASLSSLSLKHLPMEMMEGVVIDLTPAFDSGTMAYTADAGDVDAITVTAKAHPAAEVSVTVNGTAATKTDIPTYWDMLGCAAMNDSVRAYDDHSHPDSPDSPYCTTYHADATHPGLMGDAKDVVDRTFANYYDVPLTTGQNTISVMVTAEDGVETETYTVTVDAAEVSEMDRLLAEYDANGDDAIDINEVNTAIDDFFNGVIDIDEINTILDLFFG